MEGYLESKRRDTGENASSARVGREAEIPHLKIEPVRIQTSPRIETNCCAQRKTQANVLGLMGSRAVLGSPASSPCPRPRSRSKANNQQSVCRCPRLLPLITQTQRGRLATIPALRPRIPPSKRQDPSQQEECPLRKRKRNPMRIMTLQKTPQNRTDSPSSKVSS